MPGTAATGRCWATGGCADGGFEYLQCRGTCPELQLAAELGNSLLEKNKSLELTVRELQALLDERTQEIEHLRRRVSALKADCDSKVRLCEQLESNLQDSEVSCRQMEADRAVDRARLKSLQDTIQELEQRCLDYEEILESKLTNGTPATSPVSSPTKEFPVSLDDTSGTSSLQEEEAEEVARLKATLSRTKSQLARAQREKRELELELRIALEENASLHKEIQFSSSPSPRKHFKQELPNGDSLELTADTAFFEFDQDSDFSKEEECSLVRLENGIVAFGCQESMSSLSSNGNCELREDNYSLLSELIANGGPEPDIQQNFKMINLQIDSETTEEDTKLNDFQEISQLDLNSDDISDNHQDAIPNQTVQLDVPEYKRLFKELFELLRKPPPEFQCASNILETCEKATYTDDIPNLTESDSKTHDIMENIRNILRFDDETFSNFKENIIADLPENMQASIIKEFLYRNKFLESNDVVPINDQCTCTQEPKALKNASTNTDTILSPEKKYKIVLKITEAKFQNSRTNQKRKSSVQSTQTCQNDLTSYVPSKKSEFLEATNRYFEDTYEDIKVLVNKSVSTNFEESSPVDSNCNGSSHSHRHKDIFPTSPSRVKQIIKMFQTQTLG